MADELIPALPNHRAWLERLRRDVYHELFNATFGGWDEVRHVRQFTECWERGCISIITVDGMPVGMIQLFEKIDVVEIGEIQIEPSRQSQGIGTRILKDAIAQARKQRKQVTLSVGLKNERALQLYQQLGFRKVAQSKTHHYLLFDQQL